MKHGIEREIRGLFLMKYYVQKNINHFIKNDSLNISLEYKMYIVR